MSTEQPTTPPPEGSTVPEASEEPRRHSRRGVLQGAAGGLAAGAILGGGGVWAADHQHGSAHPGGSSAPSVGTGSQHDAVDLTASYPFYDQPHPAGIETPQQRHIMYMTLDMVPGATKADLQIVLARWSAGIAQLMAGQPVGPITSDRSSAVGNDTGEAYGLEPAGLTVTIGLGPNLFNDRFGITAKKPALLADLPALPSDKLKSEGSGGDLSIQACSDDPQVCYHAVRNLARMVRGRAQTRWTQLGFGRASAGRGQETPRNLFGFKDGTRNVKEPADIDKFVWIKDGSWMDGGSYQIVRKIQMNIETWDADRLSDQQDVFGREKDQGAPLSGGKEFDQPDFAKKGGDGDPVIPPRSHMALAAPENNNGVRILRRGYNYTDGINGFGQLDAGLLFIAYVNDPDHFIQLQRKLGSSDLLNEYISHVGSAIFAVPPTPSKGRYIGQTLFE